MGSSSFAEKEYSRCNLLHKETDKMGIILEKSEKEVEVVLHKPINYIKLMRTKIIIHGNNPLFLLLPNMINLHK